MATSIPQAGCKTCGYNLGSIIPPKPTLIENIVKTEWALFSNVKNAGGTADCQQDIQTFCLTRTTQAAIWEDDTLASYFSDLQNASLAGRNLMTEKYARMMEVTHPDEFAHIKNELPSLNPELVVITDQIIDCFKNWDNEIARQYPKLHKLGRKQQDYSENTSTLTYLRGELLTYSETTLNLCLRDVQNACLNKINLAEKILKGTIKYYGHDSLACLENKLAS